MLSLAAGALITDKAVNGGRSSVGRAPDCDSGGRGFNPHRPPHFLAVYNSLVDSKQLVDCK